MFVNFNNFYSYGTAFLSNCLLIISNYNSDIPNYQSISSNYSDDLAVGYSNNILVYSDSNCEISIFVNNTSIKKVVTSCNNFGAMNGFNDGTFLVITELSNTAIN